VEKRQTDKEILLTQNRNPRIYQETKKDSFNDVKIKNPLETARSVYKASARAERRRIRVESKERKTTFGHRPTSASRFLHLDPILNSVHLTQSQYNVSVIQQQQQQQRLDERDESENKVGVLSLAHIRELLAPEKKKKSKKGTPQTRKRRGRRKSMKRDEMEEKSKRKEKRFNNRLYMMKSESCVTKHIFGGYSLGVERGGEEEECEETHYISQRRR
jgi:hypothetical protein